MTSLNYVTEITSSNNKNFPFLSPPLNKVLVAPLAPSLPVSQQNRLALAHDLELC